MPTEYKLYIINNNMKIDPYNTKERYLAWKEKTKKGIPEISKDNSNLLRQYLEDMEKGINISIASKKGSRSYLRLNALRLRVLFIIKSLEKKFNLDKITDVKEEQLHNFFSEMREGVIKRKDNKEYKSVGNYVKDFKAFWHWHQKVNRKKGIDISDITLDLDTRKDKPKWVYLTEEQVRKLCNNARYDYKVLFMFLFDTGIRAPTELMNVKVSDFYNDFKELNIREETSKTFGRRIKLMICSEMIKEYIKNSQLMSEDYVFQIKPDTVNRYLKRLSLKLFGNKETEAGSRYSDISMYDFRHISCCYWLPRYKSESALKYRFGWKKSDKIHYYSELLGMKDTISEEDMFVDVTKTEIEKRMMGAEKEKDIMKEEIASLTEKLNETLALFNIVNQKLAILESRERTSNRLINTEPLMNNLN